MPKKPKKTVTPVITGIRPQGERKIIALHYHPEQIKASLHDLKEETKGEKQINDLFTDIEVLVHWALARLPLVPPPTKKAEGETKSAPEGENPAPSADREKGQ